MRDTWCFGWNSHNALGRGLSHYIEVPMCTYRLQVTYTRNIQSNSHSSRNPSLKLNRARRQFSGATSTQINFLSFLAWRYNKLGGIRFGWLLLPCMCCLVFAWSSPFHMLIKHIDGDPHACMCIMWRRLMRMVQPKNLSLISLLFIFI
jgi:hypothetical protein